MPTAPPPEPIAVVGLGCRLPGGVVDRRSAFRVFLDGVDAVGPVPPDRWDPDTVGATASGKAVPRTGGFVSDVDRFDPELFGIASREARAMDPQQRLLLEVAYAALEDAGRAPDQLTNVPVGVYVGMGLSDWARRTFGQSDPARIDAWSGTGVFDSVAAGRIAYTFGLTGPAMAVHTACSSSLVAIHLACRSLRERECELALAGGVNLLLSPEPTAYFAELAALSPTGRCRTFDAAADGYVRGEGCGLLVLARLSDALANGDEVLAVICGSATNQDGRTTGLTAPSGRAQAAVIRAALADAGLTPDAVGYVEAHGTGTPLGDPIEVGALAEVFRAGEVWLGSGKTQLGHLEAAAGVAGVIRAIAALNAARIPPHLHLTTPNPRIRLEGTPLRFAPPEGAPWAADRRRVAGVSAFGLSGTNAHVVLAAPPAREVRPEAPPFVALSARTPAALDERVDQVRAALADGLEPAAVARGFTDGRAVHRWRTSFWLPDGVPAAPVAHEARRAPELVFAFTGQGSQRVGMGRALYASEPAFRAALDAVEAAFRARTGRSLLAVVHGPPDAPIDDTRWTQPALFAIEWSLAELYRGWGVVPDAVLGHSVGEITAAAVAGVLSLDQAVALVVARAEGLAALPTGGAMVAVRGAASEIAAAAGPGVAVAAYNAPDEVVLSGDADAVHAAAAQLRERGFTTTALTVSHAFHSHRVAPAAGALAAAVDGLGLAPPRIPLYSAVTGALADAAVTTGAFWAEHLERPVRFADAVAAAVRDGHTTFVELGPRPVLCGLGARIAPDTTWVPTLHPDHDERARVYAAVGALFERGVRPDFRAVFGHGPRAAVAPYPFARERLWIDPPEVGPADGVGRYRITWEPAPRPAPRGAPEAVVRSNDPRAVLAALRGGGTVSVVADHDRADALLGLCATVALEQPSRWGRLVLVDAATPADAIEAELAAGGDDDVVSLAGGERRVPRLAGVFGRVLEPPALDPQRAVVVTGGTGAFGRAIAGWLADLGAKHLVLVSRSGGAPMPELEARGVRVDRVAADVADPEAMRGAVAGLDVGGVIHAAGVADPRPLSTVDDAGFEAVWRAKVAGLEALDAVTAGAAFFVAVSSIAAIWGAPDLGAYGAANRAMHGVIRARRARGERGSVVAFGPLAVGGMVDDTDRARFAAAGISPVPTAEALRQLGAALHPDAPAEWVAARIDWAKFGAAASVGRRRPVLDAFVTDRPAPTPAADPAWLAELAAVPADLRHRAVVDALTPELAAVLGRDPATAFDPHQPLFDLGLDSAMAVELAQRLRARTGRPIPATVAFDHPTLDALARAVLGLAAPAAAEVAARVDSDEPVAIVGFACRFPGADDPDAFWDLLVHGRDAVGPVPAGRWTDPSEVIAEATAACGGAGGYLSGDLTAFEPTFWGMSPAEAAALDPQHRLVLELGWESLERSGIAPDSLEGSRTGVWVGVSRSEYWDGLHTPNAAAVEDAYPWTGIGNASSFVAGRLAHTLGVRGPAMSIDTACSSSLVAVHLACRALRDGEVGLALAGGVNVLLSAESTVYLGRIGALSRTGRCRSFDAAADGYARGEGCGFVVLKRLSDAVRDGDRVWATIRGSAVGHDGRSGGLTVPSPAAQQEVIRRALDAAGVAPADVAVLEAHGTGTPLGDPIEIGAVRAVLGAGRTEPLVVSTVKTNLGHLESAAGIAGLVKVVLSLHHGQVPGNVHLTRPNPALPLDFPVQLPASTVPWPRGSRIAGVSSFGISGTTAHVVLEGVPAPAPADDVAGPVLWTVSADSEPALDALRAGLARSTASPAALASTLAHGRAARRLRLTAVGDSLDALRAALADAEVVEARPRPRIGFLFTGQGAQSPAMAARLYREDRAFARALDALLASAPPELRQILLEDDARVHDTTWTQPALVALSLALAQRLADAGITPECVLGHSIGELAAAAVAGVLTPADALRLAVERGARMGALPAGGGMLAARASESAVRAVVTDPAAEVAGINAPDETVLAGPLPALETARAALAAAGIDARPLTVSHAFHSAAMDPMLDGFAEVARGIPHAPPRIHLVTNLDGGPLAAVEPTHWVRHVRAPVRFADGLRAASDRVDLWIELGPRPTLSGLGARVAPGVGFVPSLAPGRDGAAALLAAIGASWARGARPAPDAIAPRRPPVPAPTTPWRRTRHWVDRTPPLRAPEPLAVSWVAPPTRDASRPRPPLDRLDATQALARARSATRGPLGFVTWGALDGDADQAAIWGLVACLAVERPDLEPFVIDLPADGDPTGLDAALATGEPRVRVRDGVALVPRFTPAALGAAPPIRGHRSYLVTGGTGGVGESVVRWLVDRGAGEVVVCARHPAPVPRGARFVAADLSAPGGAEAAVAAATLPVGGVFHLAGEAAGGWIRDLDALPGGVKVDGARALDRLLPDVELFVAFSSAIAGFGRAGAAGYAAQNAALDAIVATRVARGAHGLSIAWGPWAAGMARSESWSADGVAPLSAAEGIAALERALGATGSVTVFQADGPTVAGWFAGRPPPWLGGWPGLPEPSPARAAARPAADVAREVTAIVARLVGRDTVPPTLGLFDAGLDSLLAVELARRLSRAFGVPVPSTVAFDHPDVARLTQFVDRLLSGGAAAPTATRRAANDEPIAIVGMACRFPGAADPEGLWDLLMRKEVPIRGVPADRWRIDDWFDPTPGRVGKMYARGGGFLDDLTGFDPEFFGISPREAPTLDPQQRLLLEVGWEALERAGLAGAALRESPTGVFVGIADRGYLHRFHREGEPLYPDAWAGTGSEPSFAAGRLAYVLGVHGPALALNTTCSSSLVAVHLAAAALRRGECDTALAGGVALMLLPDDTAYLCALRALSPTDRCHTFDAAADGYVRGEGAGMVALRRLSDARRDGNPVLAVLHGSAVNHDGPSSGLTVPNGSAQEQVLRAALADAGVAPERVGYLEAHGTGTSLGDPIEVHAANAVYGERSGPLWLGAVKANLGHLELAAGMASLVKAVLALQHGVVPPHPTFTTPNPEIAFGRAVVPTEPVPLAPDALAAVSAFGLSGTNAHLVLGRGSGAPEPGPARVDRTAHVVALSAASSPALAALARGWIGRGAPADVAAAAHRRRPFAVRAAVVAADAAELDRGLAALAQSPPTTAARAGSIGFLFGGQGTQVAGMGLAWDQASPVFRAALDRCAAVVDPLLGVPLRTVLASPDHLGSTRYAQPALMAVQLALVELLRSLGIEPSAVAGHSLGELVACTVAGVWSVEDALKLAVARGQLMEDHGLPGMMAAIGSSADAVRDLLVPGAEIAAINADDEVVVAGPVAAVEEVLGALPTGVSARKLGTGRPFHTACLDPMLDPWEAAVAAVPATAPRLPVVSLCTGALASDAFTTAAFWRRHAREPVRCSDGLRALFATGVDTLVDVGAHPVLLQLAQRNAERPGLRFVATGRRDTDGWRTLAEALGGLFEAGVDPDWAAWDAGLPRRWVDGPTTPFDRRRFWLEERVDAVGSTYGVKWVADPSPPRVAPISADADLGQVMAGVRAATGHGCSIVVVSPSSPLPAQLGTLSSFADEPGEFVVVTRGAVEGDPYARAITAFVRCLSLERSDPVRAVDLAPDAGPGDLLLGLASGETEVAVRGGRRLVPRLERVPVSPATPSLSGTWLVTGGLGAVGSAFARWLGARGVSRVVVTTRTALRAGDPRSDTVSALRAAGLEVVVAVADVADEESLATLLAVHPIDGVVHAAGITEPQLVSEMTADVVERTIVGKVHGARNLDHLLGDRPLQGFVLVSSIAGVWGSRALAAYAAANAWLDGLAERRRARGAPATAVAFGPWAGGGMVDADRAAELARAGLSLLPPEPTLERVGAVLASGRAATVVVDADWGTLVNALEVRGPRPLFDAIRPAAPPPTPSAGTAVAGIVDRIVALPESEREAALIPHLERRARAVLHLDPSRPLPPTTLLSDLGFDSLMATELKAALLADGLDVPLGRVLGGPSLEELANMVAARLPAATSAAPTAAEVTPAAPSDPGHTLVWVLIAGIIVGIGLASGAFVAMGAL